MLPAVAGVVLAAVVATACVCIFSISLPILPVLAVCGPVAAALIGLFIWKIVSPEVTSSSNAETGKPKPVNEIPEEDGEGNELGPAPNEEIELGPAPDVEDIIDDDQRFDFSRLGYLKFLECREGKLFFEGYGDDCSIQFEEENTAESFNETLKKCSNVEVLTFVGSLPEGLVIRAETAENLVEVNFINILNIAEFSVRKIFDVFPKRLKCVTFEGCGELTDATVIPHLETCFIDCNKLCNIYIGDGPCGGPEHTESHSIAVEEIPLQCYCNQRTLIGVHYCSSFNFDLKGIKPSSEFEFLTSKIRMFRDDTFSFLARHRNVVGSDEITCEKIMHSVAEIPPGYRSSITNVEIFSEQLEPEGGLLFQLPEGLSVSEQIRILHRQENDTIGKYILDFNQPKGIVFNDDSAAVEHIILTNRQESGSKEVTKCSVSYKPSSNSTVEIENFTFPGGDEVYCEFRNISSEDVSLPKIKINGKDKTVVWFRKNNTIFPIAEELSANFLSKNPDTTRELSDKWGTEEWVVFPASWMAERSAPSTTPSIPIY
ncbi:MAG: hypothetical protein LBS68_01820 [Puniceicoccales bacterium]|nr:hypothetical protein [Puniceicoccales bacterium]